MELRSGRQHSSWQRQHNSNVFGKGQLEKATFQRWVALSCIFLALLLTGLEATHAHSDAAVSRNSAPCAICLSVHANAPALTFQFLPQLHAVATVIVSRPTEPKGAGAKLWLFIRPPPSA
jgi:hypothetical protein